MAKRKGTDCLWNWEDVSGETQDRLCYNRESKYFHRKCKGVCSHFETRPAIPDFIGTTREVWGENSYVKPHWKGGTAK